MPSNNEKKGAIRFPDCSKYVMVATDYNTKIVKIMLDNLKFSITDQEIIGRLLCFAESEMLSRKPQNNNYVCYSKFGALMRFDFRKSIENGYLIGFRHLEVSISPHYHFNGYLHNGNDFSLKNCLKTLRDIFGLIKLRKEEFDLLKVVNIEYGLNLVPNIEIQNLIGGISFHKRTPFIVPNAAKPYFKITDATKYKQIKVYAKGLQFMEHPEYGIDLNTFRFEVKSKQSKCIAKSGINTVKDLFREEVYNGLIQSLLDEWDNILVLNDCFQNTQYLKAAIQKGFWEKIISDRHRIKFIREREKYYRELTRINNFHHQIKLLIIDKVTSFQNVTDSTQELIMNKGKISIRGEPSLLINLESVTNQMIFIKNR
ncbi:hypothetical protein [Chryseobacterium lathyri]|uniref:Replication-associated protein G2P N-terminal domain-containing protein n=1 Tax=Chryseobacterium lathyri TaxID=395933 RepID=A0ABT9SNS5_9FLAO|nr:hypothetical protein [Chryseobacterium lathyri]MDP9961101.1 hypothetical protein [Chryseobacterium lathyri]